jgi:hypothetical protein
MKGFDSPAESSKYLLIKISYSKAFGSTRATAQRDKGSSEESERIGH